MIARIIVLDEVNIKIEGLSLDTRRKLARMFEYEVPGARFMPKVKLGRWDGKVSYFSIGGSTYLSLLDTILPVLEKDGYNAELDDRRATFPQFVFDKVYSDSYKHVVWPKGHPNAGQSIQIKDHQLNTINCFLKNTTGISVLPTGSGKCLGYNTELTLKFINDTDFCKFVLERSNIDNTSRKSYTIDMKIGRFFDLVTEFSGNIFHHNIEVPIKLLEVYINTPKGSKQIKYLVKKLDLPTVKVILSNGYTLECAEGHLLLTETGVKPVRDLQESCRILHKHGIYKIISIQKLNNNSCYDIGIDSPHLYYDTNGLIHHNTIVTAILSNKIEKYGRSVVIVPTKDLVVQTEDDYINFGLDVGVYYGNRKEYNKKHTICTWQSLDVLTKKDETNYNPFFKDVVCVITDECFSPDTKVLTTFGYKEISSIVPGEKIINYCEETNLFEEDIVVKVYKNLEKSAKADMIELVVDNTVTKVTSNHKFLTKTGWVSAKDLTVNHRIVTTNMIRYHKMSSKKIIERPNAVYTLGIAKNHNYIVNNMVVENCHKTKANVIQRLLTGPMANAPIRWGLTGTLPKSPSELTALTTCIGPVLGKVQTKDLQDAGILSKIHIHIWQLQDRAMPVFRLYQQELEWLVSNEARLAFLASKLHSLGNNGNTLMLIDRVVTGELLQKLLPDAVFIYGNVASDVRKEEYKKIQSVDNKIIIATYGVASTGISINRIFNLVLLEPGKSFVKVIQSIGRGLRIAEDKDFVNVYDVCSTSKYSKRHLTERKAFYNDAQYKFSIEKVNY